LKSRTKPESGPHPFSGPEPDAPDAATGRSRFSHWFENVFWYHYKWYLIISIAVLATAAFFIHDALMRTTPDFQFVVVSNNFVSNGSIAELTDLASEVFRDAGSGRPSDSLGHGLHLSAEGQFGIAAYSKLATMLLDDDMRFFIFDADLLEHFFNEPDGFYDLGALGFRAVEGKPWLADVSGLPLMERIGLSGMTCFAAIQVPHRLDAGALSPDPGHLAFLNAIFNAQ